MLMEVLLYMCLSATLLYIGDSLYDYLSKEFTRTRVMDYVQQPKEEYERIMDSIRNNYEQKQTLFNTQQNAGAGGRRAAAGGGGGGAGGDSAMREKLLQHIRRSRAGVGAEQPQRGRGGVSFVPNQDTRRNTEAREIMYPTQDLTIRDDVSVFTDYSEVAPMGR